MICEEREGMIELRAARDSLITSTNLGSIPSQLNRTHG